MKASILTLNEMLMSQGRDIHTLKAKKNEEDRLEKLTKQVTALSNTVNNKLDQTVLSIKRGETANRQSHCSPCGEI